jgi:hypothetical protein
MIVIDKYFGRDTYGHEDAGTGALVEAVEKIRASRSAQNRRWPRRAQRLEA